MNKTIYHYHPETGVLIGVGVADQSPLEDDVFLIPANATAEAPPVCSAGQRQIFRDGAWVIEDIPQPGADPVPSLDKIKALAWCSIKAERERRTEAGGYRVDTHWFHSDQKSRSQQLGLARKADRIEAAGGDMDAVMHDADGNPIAWKCMGGSWVPMTARLAQQIAAAAESSDLAIHKAAEVHKAAMEASDDPESYDFSTGWPKVFGE